MADPSSQSRPTSLNPDADPFLYTSTFLSPPKLLLPVPPSGVILGPPLHGYPHPPPTFGLFYNVLPQVPSPWLCSDAFRGAGGASLGCVGNNNNSDMKSDHRKCSKIITKWVPQVRDETADLQFPPAFQLMPFETTTLMIKNIPNQLRRNHLLNILDEHCKWKNNGISCDSNNNNRFGVSRRMSEYDFVYLPMDFRKYWYDGKISNLGYAFVNFTTPSAASEFCKAFHRRQWEVAVNKKVCEIKRAKLQGLKPLMEAFRNKIFWCHANNYLPVVLEPPSDGGRRYRATPVGKRIGRPPPCPIKKLSKLIADTCVN